MREVLEKNKTSPVVRLNPKDEEFFIERFAQILLMQLEHENEYEEKTSRLFKTIPTNGSRI